MSNTIITITGPSCTGKTTLTRMLMATGKYTEIISTTTRPMRAGDVNGKDYHFVSPEEFHNIEMLETIEFNGNFYGGSVAEFEEKFASGLIPVIVVEPNGMQQININAERRGWKVFNVFIRIDPEVQARRFLSRLCDDYRSILGTGDFSDYDKILTEYSSRMVVMQNVESGWFKQYLDWAPADQCLTFSGFDKDNESTVVQTIRNSAEPELAYSA